MNGILENDNLFVAGQRAWHGLGTVLDNPPTSADALRVAKLNWTVNPVPLYAKGNQDIPVSGYVANIRSDTQEILGIVTGKYTICQNVDAFDFVDDIMAQKDHEVHYESAGSLFNGKKVWMLARMENRKVLDDVVETYLCFSNSHDGKSSIRCCLTNVRVVCNNTLQLATETAKRTWAVRHMGTIEGKRMEAMHTLGLATDYFQAMEKKAQDMYITKVDFNKFLDKLVPVENNVGERLRKNNEYVRETIATIYNTKQDLGNIRGTAWGAYNAIADFYSNTAPLRNAPTYRERKFNEFITSSALLEKAQGLLVA